MQHYCGKWQELSATNPPKYGGDEGLESIPGADRAAALRYLIAALNIEEKSSRNHDDWRKICYWMCANYRLWPHYTDPNEAGFVAVRAHALQRLKSLGEVEELRFA